MTVWCCPLSNVGDIKRSFVLARGVKLEAAMMAFGVEVDGRGGGEGVCGSGVRMWVGLRIVFLQRGAKKVYAVDTAYGVLAWTLRKGVSGWW